LVLPAGYKLGPYEIVEPLGAGGMGEVYRARDTRLGRDVAIKILPQHLASTPDARQRFEREARAVSRLSHPNICMLFDVGRDDETEFIVMEYLQGETLSQRIRRGPLSLHDATNIALQVARALAEAHSHGIIHRDVKPSNILLARQGVAKVIDFGLARVSSAVAATQSQGGTTGTIGYMAPEQAIGRPVDPGTDVWALGVVLAEMVSGANPFQRENPSAILVAILNEPPAPAANAPLELQKIIYRALAKNPAERFSDCAEFAEELEAFRSTILSSTSSQPIDHTAPTATISAAEMQKYLSHASASSWPAATGQRPLSRWWLVPAAVLLVAAVAFAVPSLRARITAAFVGSSEKHIAVLPFDNIGNNPANEALAEGLMDSLTGKLSDLDVGGKSLWVVPSTEVRHRKISDPTSALRELGANLVVKGSIARDGQDVHLTVNLIDTKDLRQIGSASLEDRAGDLATLQNQAVSRLAHLMHVTVSADMLRDTGGAVTPAAYEGYLNALGYMQRYDKPGNLDRAISALNDAVKTDPRFALGYAQLAEAFRVKYGQDRNLKWLDEAAANGQKAAELDDHLPAVYVTLARTHDATGKHDLALQEFQHALQINPHDVNALAGLAGTYERIGRVADAEATFQKAAALRPDFWDGYNMLGMFYTRQGKNQEAVTQFQHVIELTPDNAPAYLNLGAVYLNMGDPKVQPLAEQALKKSVELSPSYAAYANLGILYYNEKRFDQSAAITEKALALNDKDYQVWSNLVASYVWLRQDDKASAARSSEQKLVEDLVKVQPHDATAQSELAGLYAAANQRDKAVIRIEAALASAPADPRVLLNVADAYEALGDRRHALEYVRSAIANGYPMDALQIDPALQRLLGDPNFQKKEKQ